MKSKIIMSINQSILQNLINAADSMFNVKEVIFVFSNWKNDGKSEDRRIKVLESITKYQPDQNQIIAKAIKTLESGKDGIYCLQQVLEHYENVDLIARKIDAPQTQENESSEVKTLRERIHRASCSNASQKESFKTTTGATRAQTTGFVYSGTSIQSMFECPFATTQSTNIINSEDGSNLPQFEHIPFQRINSIAAVPLPTQENLLLYDLIHCLTGLRGDYIFPVDSKLRLEEEKSFQLKILDEVHSSLRDIAEDILPMATYYATVQRFAQNAEFTNSGQVLQALSETLNLLLQDYILLLTQLEDEFNEGRLSLHKMLYYLRPTLGTMEILASVVNEINEHNIRGGRALTLLYKKINELTGDETARKFIIKLIEAAAVPYMNTLQLWIQKGVIIDPQNEFLVTDFDTAVADREAPEKSSATYWEKRYTVLPERIPCFLEKQANIILRTGKYLNVIRQCGKHTMKTLDMHLKFNASNQKYITDIENAYDFASQTLLDVLLKENDLMGHLMSVRGYSLMCQGDFITLFMDACDEELMKNVDQVLPLKLENLLGLTVRITTAKNDPYKDDVHCELLTYDLVTQIAKIMHDEAGVSSANMRLDSTGMECFAFCYDVKWPVSLVLNHIALNKYQLLFRQLFFLKHVERQLWKVWKRNTLANKFEIDCTDLYRHAFVLSHSMMCVIQHFEYYMNAEVIEPNWHIFLEKMKQVNDVDEVLSFHQDFLDSCVRNCMLTDTAPLHRLIFNIANLCLKYAEFLLPIETRMAPADTFNARVTKFSNDFKKQVNDLFQQLTDVAAKHPADRFINLVHRVNFNGFYTQETDKISSKLHRFHLN